MTSNKIVTIIFMAFCSSCGPQPTAAPGTGGATQPPCGGGDTKAVTAALSANCTSCHDGTSHPLDFKDLKIFKGSKSVARIKNGSMPPGGGLPEEAKGILLKYLEGS